MSVFASLLAREARLLFRRPAELANPLVFFAIVIAMFPLAVGPETQLLQTLSPGLLWVAALLAVLLSLDGLFRSDFEDGSLEQWVLSPHPLALLVLAKVLAHWAFSGLALVILSPLLALMLGLPVACLPVLLMSLSRVTGELRLGTGGHAALANDGDRAQHSAATHQRCRRSRPEGTRRPAGNARYPACSSGVRSFLSRL